MIVWFDRKFFAVEPNFPQNPVKLDDDLIRQIIFRSQTKLTEKIRQIAWWCDLTENSSWSKLETANLTKFP